MTPSKKMRFKNPHVTGEKKNLLNAFLWLIGFYNDTKCLPTIPNDFQYPNPLSPLKPQSPRITWVNHSTFIIELENRRILTDPIWSQRCGPFNLLGPKRHFQPPIPIKKLQNIDYVLMSHNHYDHLDKRTVLELHALFPQIVWIVPFRLKKWFIKKKIHNVIELNWWESTSVPLGQNTSLKITAVPAQHQSGRHLFDYNHSLWSGFVVQSQTPVPKTFYFAGDTGYNDHDFKAIGQAFPNIDLSLIPLGAYIPRSIMKSMHINPFEAALIHQEVGSNLSIGMHWHTFRLSGEKLKRPPYDLYMALKKLKDDPLNFRILNPGQTLNW